MIVIFDIFEPSAFQNIAYVGSSQNLSLSVCLSLS